MNRLARFIVEKRLWFFLLFVGIVVYCIFGIPKIEVEYEITKYLPHNTDTSNAIAIMDDEFGKTGVATILVRGIEKDNATQLAVRFGDIDGVMNVSFSADNPRSYASGSALYTITFSGNGKDARAVGAYNATIAEIRKGGYSYCVPTPLVNDYAERLSSEMVIIIAISAAVIIGVLLFTSKSFAEVLAFPIVFGVAAVMNMGTNHWLGKISFISNTVCIILQLALAIDYAIILCHRFTEEKDKAPSDPQAALITALAKAIPEIASSSLTTVSGLVALMFMQLGLGFDLGMVLAKSIICSLLTVFFLMPCLLMWCSKLMDKTRHRCFVPKVMFLGRGVVKARYVLIALFVVLFGLGAWLSQTIDYCYSQNSIDTSRPNETMIAQAEQARVFGENNTFVVLVPKSMSPEKQRELAATVMRELQACDITPSGQPVGWALIALPSSSDGEKSYYLTDMITSDELADIAAIEPSKAELVFDLYAANHGGKPSDGEYRIRADELFDYIFGNKLMSSFVSDEMVAKKRELEFGKSQLVGKNHYRLIFGIDAAVESESTFAFIKRLTPKIKASGSSAVFAGASMSAYDLNASFRTDNILISVLTVAFIFLILAVTFKSYGIPIVLVLVIQGAIFINFSIPVIAGNNLFFFVYLIASAIQMGATIDYAILMTNRFRSLKSATDKKTAIAKAISESFPTIMTSGTIMTVASFLVGFLTSDPLIASMGVTLAFGTIISIISVLTVLPALLYVLDKPLEKTVLHGKLVSIAASNAPAQCDRGARSSNAVDVGDVPDTINMCESGEAEQEVAAVSESDKNK